MDFNISKDQHEYRQAVIDFAKESLNDESCYEEFSYELWKKISDFGLLGLNIAEGYGGVEESYLTAAIVYEALGYACKNSGFIFAISNHLWVGQNLIYLFGSDDLKEKYIPDMVAGKKIAGIAITEPEAGSDAFGMHTKASLDGENYILNGSKTFISNGPIADVFVVLAVTEPEPVKKLSAFVVQRGFEGLKIGKPIEKMGLHACPAGDLVFSDCVVPKENLIGRLHQGNMILNAAMEWERCFEFAPHLGAMQRIMEECILHANARKQYGKSIGEYQAVSHMIADMKSAIEMARLMLYKIACLKDSRRSAFFESSMFKLFVSENYIKTCRNAMQIFGAYGYSKEYGIERELRDSLASSIYSGTNELQRNIIYSMANSYYF